MTRSKFVIVGAGSRGRGYAELLYKNHHEETEVIAVADPDQDRREIIAAQWNIPESRQYEDWHEVVGQERFADAVCICTQDAMHVDPAVAFAKKGYHLLLEKPMAPTAEGCCEIVDAVKKTGVMMAVCHVLRYTPPTRKLKQLIMEGRIGDVIGIQQLEPIGYWHMAHSFVRGNWRNEAESSSMLLAKCCHDVDWMRHIMGVPIKRVSSFGALKHFRSEEKPQGAADRCLDCRIEPHCPYSAKKIYLKRSQEGNTGWPLDVLSIQQDPKTIEQALREGPYGRCVYACDNDVTDHQVVNFQFQGGRSGVLTLSAFTPMEGRHTRVFGSLGHVHMLPESLRIYDFRTDEWEEVDYSCLRASDAAGGHGGGDAGIVAGFTKALRQKDPSAILSGPDESLETHLAVFAAEQARHRGTVETVNP